MSAKTHLMASPCDILRKRESATAAMIRQIDAKLTRLGSARRERAAALNAIRCELVRASKAAPVVPVPDERTG